jgi:hypothetical protein
VYRIPALLRLRLLEQSLLEKLAGTHGIDHFAHQRHEIENMLSSRRKLSIREQLWEHHDVILALINTVMHGSNKFRHKVLKMFVNFSADGNIAVEMVEGDIKFMEPLVSLVRDILAPLADVLAEKAVEVEEVEEEPTPDPRYLPKVQAFFKSRFHSIFEMWVFFDRHGNWSVSVQDVKELGKQLAPQASGIKLSEIALVMDFKKMKFLDPHETIRAIAWHELPGEGKTVPLTRALEEVTLRRKEIVSEIKHKMKAINEIFVKEQAAAKQRAIRERIAARQHAAPATTPKFKRTASDKEANMQDKVHSHSPRIDETLKVSKEIGDGGEAKDSKEHVTLAGSVHGGTSDKAQGSQDATVRGGGDVDGEREREGEKDTLQHTGSDDTAGVLDVEVHDDDDDDLDSDLDEHEDEEAMAKKAERKRLETEKRKQQKIQQELVETYKKLNKNDSISLEMLLTIMLNVSKDEETHERLLEELEVVPVLRPLLILDPNIHSQPRNIAAEILEELGEDFDWKQEGSVALSDYQLAKMSKITSKWLNGILHGAFNSWLDSTRLLKVHTMSMLQCYKINSADAMLPAAAGVANKALGIKIVIDILSRHQLGHLPVFAYGPRSRALTSADACTRAVPRGRPRRRYLAWQDRCECRVHAGALGCAEGL